MANLGGHTLRVINGGMIQFNLTIQFKPTTLDTHDESIQFDDSLQFNSATPRKRPPASAARTGAASAIVGGRLRRSG